MSESKGVEMEASDRQWARKLGRRLGLQAFRVSANALIADELARAIDKQHARRVEYLLAAPLPSLFNKHPQLPNPDSAFTDAWNRLSEFAHEKARKKYPDLYDKHSLSPLSAAVLADFPAGVDMLLAKGAIPFHRNPASPTGYGGALGAAVFHGKLDLVTKLMAQACVQAELQSQPAFRNYLLLTAVGTDCQATLDHLCKCDPDMAEKGRVYGDRKVSDFALGDGIFAARDRLKAKRAFDAAQNPPVSKYGHQPSCRPDTSPKL